MRFQPETTEANVRVERPLENSLRSRSCAFTARSTFSYLISASLAKLYRYDEVSGDRGLGYYLCTQSKWDSEMIQNYDRISSIFYRRLMSTIWRPDEGRMNKQPSVCYDDWRQTVLMPNTNTILRYITEFALRTGLRPVLNACSKV